MDVLLNFVTETQSVRQADTLVKKLGVTTEQTATKVNNLGKNMRLTKGPTSALSTTAGQLGVQFQDVAVQAQMGTDAVRIFSQQGPQILSIFGPTGAVFGALAAIGVVVGTTIAEAFGLAEDSAEKFTASIKIVSDTVNTLSDDTYGLTESLLELAQKSESAARLQLAIAMDAAAIAASKAREQIIALGIEGEGMYRSIEGASGGFQRLLLEFDNIVKNGYGPERTMKALRDGAEQAGISIEQANHLFALFAATIDPNGGAQSLVVFTSELANVAIAAGASDIETKQFVASLLDMAVKAETAEEKMRILREGLENLPNAIGKSDDKAIQFVLRMEQMAKEAGKTREEILKMQAAMIEDPTLKARAEAAIKIIEDQRKAEEKAEADRKKAAEDEAFRKRVIALGVQKTIQLQKEQERERKRAEAEQAREDAERTKRIEKEKELRVKDALERMKRDKEVKENAIKTAEEGFQALGQYNKTAFAAYKAYASGKAVMDTYAGATKAMAEIPFPFNIAAAAGIVAMGLANVATIQSQQYQGRALGGQVRGGQTYVVGERGPELLTMGGSGTVTPNEKLRGATGTQSVSETVNINFQITANDAAGFDQLLVARRGMIVSMINQAMNNRGRRGLV